MPDKEEKSQTVPGNQKQIFTRKQEDLKLKERLLAAPELFITNKGSDEYLDRLSLKIQLRGGDEFTLEEYITQNMVEYRPRFYREYYYEIANLHGLDKSVMDNYQKPQCAADFTVQFIYGRFPMKVLNFLREKSPWTAIPGIRANKLFQYLSKIASDQLDLIIEQAVQVMKESKNLSEFKMKYSIKYKVYFQIDMFADTNIN